MKFYLILVFNCLAGVASISGQNKTRKHGENGWYVPQQNGSFNWVDKDVAENYIEFMNKMNLFGVTTNPVNYYLYTRLNSNNKQKISVNKKDISASNFNSDNPTRFIIHGWFQGEFSDMNKKIRDAWLSLGDYNIIVVDWSRARSLDYISSVIAVPTVGQKLANFIDFLVNNFGMSLNSTHLIGHSLGAHVAGYAGKNIKTGQIHTIIALDPALPLFCYDKPDKRLSKDDAFYVESIQTYGGIIGFLKPIGKCTFYPNGGKSQPNCPIDFSACSHQRSITYYTEAIVRNNFAAIICNSYKDAISKNCGATYSSVRMAAATNAFMVQGSFYVPVNDNSPYGIMA